jgi:hypothetical protein
MVFVLNFKATMEYAKKKEIRAEQPAEARRRRSDIDRLVGSGGPAGTRRTLYCM